MKKVAIIGVGMTRFGKFLDKSLAELGCTAIWSAIKDSNINPKDIGAIYVANSIGGLITGQEGVRGEVIARYAGLGGMPVINVENACAGGTTALRGAMLEVSSGKCDFALAVGVEKMFCDDTARSIKALASDSDIRYAAIGFQFTAYYAMNVKKFMANYGVTKEHLANVAVKNSYNGSLNPYAQFQKPHTIDEVLNSRMISDPLTLYMCSTMTDGAAAAVVCAEGKKRKYRRTGAIGISSCALRSGMFRPPNDEGPNTVTLTANEAYNEAGIGPGDIDVVEVHDAMSPAELYHYVELGLCKPEEAKYLIDEKRTWITGDIPVNPSGGLVGRGHPVSATGLAQIAELVWQLRGEAGARQVGNNPKVGLAQNSGGYVDNDNAACTVTILQK